LDWPPPSYARRPQRSRRAPGRSTARRSATACSDGSSVTRTGNFSRDEQGNRWQRIGNFTFGSNGETYNRIGTMTYDNKGNSWSQVGDHTYARDGSSCTAAGNQVRCSGGHGDDPGAAAKLVKPGLVGTE
jgi:hypothetical protein